MGDKIVTPLARGGTPEMGVMMISSLDRVWTRPNNRFISFHAPGNVNVEIDVGVVGNGKELGN